MKKLAIIIFFCVTLPAVFTAKGQNHGAEMYQCEDEFGKYESSFPCEDTPTACACSKCYIQIDCNSYGCPNSRCPSNLCPCYWCYGNFACGTHNNCPALNPPGGDPNDPNDPNNPYGPYDPGIGPGGPSGPSGPSNPGNNGWDNMPFDCAGVYGGRARWDTYCPTRCVGGTTGNKPCDCNGTPGGTAYKDSCNNCVDGTTGRAPCVQDCTGEWGGGAYTRVCEGQTVCIDGNQGTFDNHLTGNMLTQFNDAKNNMMLNCLKAALINNLDVNYGINISSGTGSPGTFNPCDYSITFNSNSGVSSYSLTGELFHAYQEQFLNGKLTLIKNDIAHNYIGGSNIEFEEKAMNILAGMLGDGYANVAGVTKLIIWSENFLTNHNNLNNIVLTQPEKNAWFEALEEFRTYYLNNPQLGGFFYNKPIDYNMLPNSLLSLLKFSNCN